MQEIRPPNPPLSGAPKWARTIRESFANLTRVRFDLHGIPASGRVVRWGTRGVDDVYQIVLDGSNRKVIWPTALCRIVFDGHQEARAATKPSDAPSAPPSAQNLAIALNPTAAGPADLSADIVRASRAALRSATPLAPSLTGLLSHPAPQVPFRPNLFLILLLALPMLCALRMLPPLPPPPQPSSFVSPKRPLFPLPLMLQLSIPQVLPQLTRTAAL